MRFAQFSIGWMLLVLFFTAGSFAQVTVVNIIPSTNSAETNDDSEPNLAVNPANPLQIAATAFTPDSSGTPHAVPVFLSNDGGLTWTESSFVPVATNNNCPASCDITLRFGGFSNTLYVGWLDGLISFFSASIEYNMLRTTPFPGPPAATVLENIPETTSFRDQPFVQATSVIFDPTGGTGNDRIYVGSNDASVGSKSGTIDQSDNVGTPPPPAGLASKHPELRTTCGNDGPSVRPAMHPDGTVYTAFFRWTTGCSSGTSTTADVIVVRDDNWGRQVPPYSAITDSSDSVAGVKVGPGVSIPFSYSGGGYADMGTERVGSQLAIAVDPRNSQTVYVAWADGTTGTNYTIHVYRSTLGGASGSWTNVKNVTRATNPGLAVNIRGKVGLLYQKLVAPGTCNAKGGATACWETHLERSTDGTTWASDLTLANLPDLQGPSPLNPSIGDYDYLLAVGKDFYGIFSGFNTFAAPITTNFPQTVSYQRFNDGAGSFYVDAAHTSTVSKSVDPFFFHVVEEAAGDDFYVRDWTDTPTSGDNGVEPSTHSDFWSRPDVWNRRGTLDGSPFPGDQPANEDAGNGAGNVGDNWAFTRIRRNVGGAAASVTAHFLVSKFGTGSNYVDNGSTDPDVSLDPGDVTVPFVAGDSGPQISPAYHWHLNAIAGNHLCLAVEISTPADPYIPPSLVGQAPGWTTGTDTRIVDDNNKAQRNMGLSTTPARGVGMIGSFCAIAHNAATFPRDMTLRYEASPEVLRRLKNVSVRVAGTQAETNAVVEREGMLTLPGMQPGENRWVCSNFGAPEGKEGEILAINFHEMVKDTAVNGFSVGVHLDSMSRVIRDTLELHRSAFTRLHALFKIAVGREEAAGAEALLHEKELSEKSYLRFLKTHMKRVQLGIDQLIQLERAGDPFDLQAAIKQLATAVGSGNAGDASVAHAALMNKLDSFESMRELEQGDAADILQMIRWQKELYAKVPQLQQLKLAREIEYKSQHFIQDFGLHRVKASDYPRLIRELFAAFKETAAAVKSAGVQLAPEIANMEKNLDSVRALEKAHRNYLLKLQALTK